MDEYEMLEDELKEVYQEYIRKFRCLAYVEQQLEEMERLENEEKAVCIQLKKNNNKLEVKMFSPTLYDFPHLHMWQEREEKIKKMVAKIRQAEIEQVEGEEEVEGPSAGGKIRTRRDPTGRQRVFGSMTAPDKVGF